VEVRIETGGGAVGLSAAAGLVAAIAAASEAASVSTAAPSERRLRQFARCGAFEMGVSDILGIPFVGVLAVLWTDLDGP
jgi:uncharacterized membrane protein YdbT with pleckstrin-like domain